MSHVSSGAVLTLVVPLSLLVFVIALWAFTQRRGVRVPVDRPVQVAPGLTEIVAMIRGTSADETLLKRFRQGTVSSGKGARLLGLSRRDFLELLAREGVPLYDPTDQELQDECKAVERPKSKGTDR